MGPEGFQRATGKPFGRARRRETLCVYMHVMLQFVENLQGCAGGAIALPAHRHRMDLPRRVS